MAKASSRAVPKKESDTKNYKAVDYSSRIGAGFKVLGVLILFGVVLCLYWSRPTPKTDDRALRGSTMALLQSTYDTLSNLKKPVKDSDSAYEKLYEITLCARCQGTGKVTDKEGEDVVCPDCNGLGVSLKQDTPGVAFKTALISPALCQICKGSGKDNYAVCKDCKGKGYDAGKVTIAQILRDLQNKVIHDAYGGVIKIEVTDLGPKSEYTIISAGKDRRFGTKDDLKVSNPVGGTE